MPLTKLTPSSCATSTCLRNLGSWRTIHGFHNEYLLAPDAATLAKLTRMTIIDQHEGNLPDPTKWVLPLGDYYRWGRTGKGPLSFSSLLPRAALMKWLYAVFFKIALPVNRHGVAFHELILSPLNATVIFRILIHLQHLGYPSHWLSDFLDCILSNYVVTSARPPRTSPLTIAETKKDRPVKKMSVAPFVLEMTTLLLMFEPILPFTVMTKDLPPPSAVHEYIVTVPRSKRGLPPMAFERQGWILVFHHTKLWELLDDEDVFSYCDLRGLLDGSWDAKMNSIEAQDVYKFRDEGLVLVSTLKYDAKAMEATVWMLEEKMDAMLRDGNWMCGLWSTEIWKSCDAVKVYEGGLRGVRKVKRWFE